MGDTRHNAIVITCDRNDITEIVHKKAMELFEGKVTSIVEGVKEDYRSFLIVPDGGKERWDTSNEWDNKRDEFFKWLETHEVVELGETKKDVVGIYVDCVEVEYGGELNGSRIVRTNEY